MTKRYNAGSWANHYRKNNFKIPMKYTPPPNVETPNTITFSIAEKDNNEPHSKQNVEVFLASNNWKSTQSLPNVNCNVFLTLYCNYK
ncbi:hypothetical protein [Candidatus Tisiphia endosymbiont of Nedyus quadrimaculatus]|uniref:hypothetical protein n=1 Tax=Candidatus Tisiphia endosymbiont of Nedyus quadrimaculatus TaxID=3139332 RepID=UPI00345F0B70